MTNIDKEIKGAAGIVTEMLINKGFHIFEQKLADTGSVYVRASKKYRFGKIYVRIRIADHPSNGSNHDFWYDIRAKDPMSKLEGYLQGYLKKIEAHEQLLNAEASKF